MESYYLCTAFGVFDNCKGLDSAAVHKKYPGVSFLPDYRLHYFIDEQDMDSLVMKGHPKSINDIDDYLAEERFYE